MPKPYRPLAAALWMTGSIAGFSAMAVAGRMASAVHDTFEIMTWRSLLGLCIVAGFMLVSGRSRQVRPARLGGHLTRNLFHFAGQNLWFWALGTIPLAQVFALEFTSPIWVILLSFLFLKEPLTRPRALATGLGFAGILVVARPDFVTLDAGVAAAAASAVCFASTMILTKSLTRTETTLSILFWLTLMQLCFGLVATLHDGAMTWPTMQSLPWLVVIGLAGLSGHLCLTNALSMASANFVVPIDFARLPVIALVGMLFFGEGLDMWVLLGGAVILFANLISIRAESRSARVLPI